MLSVLDAQAATHQGCEGFVEDATAPIEWKAGTGAEGPSPNTQLVIGECFFSKKRIAKNEADFLRKHAPGLFKVALPSPINFAVVFWRQGRSEMAYASPGAFLAHAAKILAKALSDEGVPYIQLDAPSHWGDPALKAKYERLFNELKNPFHLKPAALYEGSMRLHDTLPLDQLALSPRCGFASSGRGNPLTEEQQWRKLELVSEVAKKVWKH